MEHRYINLYRPTVRRYSGAVWCSGGTTQLGLGRRQRMLRLGRPGIIGARTAVAMPCLAPWQHVVWCLPEVVCMYLVCYTYVYSQLIPGSPDTRRRRRCVMCVMDEPDPRFRHPS